MRSPTISTALLGLTATSIAMPLLKRETRGPVISTDFPDPTIIKVGDTWHAFGTQSIFDYTNIKTQYATSSDFNNWELQEGYDALGSLPSWVDQANPKVWAPDVFALDDGSYIMYYSATTNTGGDGRFHCVGAARSNTVEGPYEPVSDSPLVCPLNEGGAIDASGFHDADGKRYVLYKEDGNALGLGGRCGNDVAPQRDTWLVIQEVEQDGYTFIGGGKRILNRDAADGPLIEGPSLVRMAGGVYVLHFSSQCYTEEHYSSSYATADNVWGPYTKTQYPLIVSGSHPNTFGTGHADVDIDGVHAAFHGYDGRENIGNVRAMYVARLVWNGDSRTVSLGN